MQFPTYEEDLKMKVTKAIIPAAGLGQDFYQPRKPSLRKCYRL